MEMLKTDDTKGITFADEDKMRNIGMPYFQKMLDDYAKTHPKDKSAGKITLDYDAMKDTNYKGIAQGLIKTLSAVNGDWEKICDKLTFDEKIVMSASTGTDYDISTQNQSAKEFDEACIKRYNNLNIPTYMREDVKKILNGEDIGFHFDEKSYIIADSDDIRHERGSEDFIVEMNKGRDEYHQSQILQGFFANMEGAQRAQESDKNIHESASSEKQTNENEASDASRKTNERHLRSDRLNPSYGANLIDSYRNSENSIGLTESEIAKKRGFGDDVTVLFDCGLTTAREGYKALLKYQTSHPEDVVCMAFQDYIGFRADREFTDQGITDYFNAMSQYFTNGRNLFPEDKFLDWKKCCNEQMNNGTYGCNLNNAIEISMALSEDKPFDEVAKTLNQQDFANGSKDDVMSIVTEFAPKGQEFADYLQQDGHGAKGRGDEDIVTDTPQDGHDEDQP